MAETHSARIDSITYELAKAYAEEKEIPIACAIGEILACPIKRRALSEGKKVPVKVNEGDKKREKKK